MFCVFERFLEKMLRKRLASLPMIESGSATKEVIPIKRKSLNPKRVWDKYCWICHRGKTNLSCSFCIRTYHDRCIGSKDSGQKCLVCIRLDEANKMRYGKKFFFKKAICVILNTLSFTLNNY